VRKSCARATAPALNVQADRIAIETGDDISVSLRFERDVTLSRRKRLVCDFSPSLFFRERASGWPSGVRKNGVEFASVTADQPSKLYRNIVKPPVRSGDKMPQPRHDHLTTGTSTSGRV